MEVAGKGPTLQVSNSQVDDNIQQHVPVLLIYHIVTYNMCANAITIIKHNSTSKFGSAAYTQCVYHNLYLLYSRRYTNIIVGVIEHFNFMYNINVILFQALVV